MSKVEFNLREGVETGYQPEVPYSAAAAEVMKKRLQREIDEFRKRISDELR